MCNNINDNDNKNPTCGVRSSDNETFYKLQFLQVFLQWRSFLHSTSQINVTVNECHLKHGSEN